MDRTLKQSKKGMRQFMRANYKDEHLISAIDRCRAGSLQFNDCDCFIGHVCVERGVTAQYWLQRARLLPYAVEGENGYQRLADNDGKRQRRLLPMLRAEIRRRARLIVLPNDAEIKIVR